jgi:hypothetical protein
MEAPNIEQMPVATRLKRPSSRTSLGELSCCVDKFLSNG